MIVDAKANFAAIELARLTFLLRSKAMMAGWPKNFTSVLKVVLDEDGEFDIYYPPLLEGDIENLEYGLTEHQVPRPVIRPFLTHINEYVSSKFKLDASDYAMSLMENIW